MTDEFEVKKLSPLSEETIPQFPTSRRSGYLEDSVDAWLAQHYAEVQQMIEYQNYCVDVVEALKAQKAQLEEQLANVPVVDTSVEDELRGVIEEQNNIIGDLNDRVVEAEARALSAEQAAAATPARPSVEEEAAESSSLLQNAARLARQHIEEAKLDAEKIRERAEQTVIDLRKDIEHLDGLRFATFHTLESFFTKELHKLVSDPTFAGIVDSEDIQAGDYAPDELSNPEPETTTDSVEEVVYSEEQGEPATGDGETQEETENPDDTNEGVTYE